MVTAIPPSGLVILGQEHDHVADLERLARAPALRIAGRGLDLSRGITRAVCRHLGAPDDTVIDAVLRDFTLPRGRLNRHDYATLTVIDGSYNANPLSMRLALDTLLEAAASGRRRVAILGVMAELGEEAHRYHEEIGAYARRRAHLIVGVGELAKDYRPDHWYETAESCAAGVGELLRPNDCVLVKGSASVRLKQVTAKLCEIGERPAQHRTGHRGDE
jgi:UDP-N-acetylmuramoyl-tripeptide--D-alanyl-D-alanine ligase